MVEPRPNANDASDWLDAFSSALASGEIERASSLFGDECFWRDLVAFTWNVKTLEGRDEIAAMLGAQLAAANPTIWRIDGEPTQSNGVDGSVDHLRNKACPRARNPAPEGRSRLDVAYGHRGAQGL